MADVARTAGVSLSTVSHVINETRFVKEDTAARVHAAIAEIGYVHNTIARSLVTSSTNTIGLCLSLSSNPYWTDLVAILEEELKRRGYLVLLAETREDAEVELEVVQSLYQRRVDGFFVAPVAGSDEHALRWLEQHHVPATLIDRTPSERFNQVGPDNEAGMRTLVEHIAGHGHRRIAMLSALAGVATTVERVRGFRAAVHALGLDDDPTLSRDGAGTRHGAYAAVRALFTSADPPTGLIIGDNRMARGALDAVRHLGLRVPGDLALAVFDDFEWADMVEPPLTAMQQPLNELARVAVDLLLERIVDPDAAPRTVRVMPALVCRASCGCARDASGR